ncbi:hypothetical protein ACLB1S_05880 [Escherichia coli]
MVCVRSPSSTGRWRWINRERRAKNGEPPLDIAAIPLDDKKSFDMLQRSETTAVFQLESRGMKDLDKDVCNLTASKI